MLDAKMLAVAVQILLIAGALNWGLVAYNGTDAVKLLLGDGELQRYVKFAVAAAGAYAAYRLYLAYAQ